MKEELYSSREAEAQDRAIRPQIAAGRLGSPDRAIRDQRPMERLQYLADRASRLSSMVDGIIGRVEGHTAPASINVGAQTASPPPYPYIEQIDRIQSALEIVEQRLGRLGELV